jgi:hypothetical protein
MTNYSENPGSVRVDYFKPSGKWYMTEALDMSGFYDHGIYPGEAVRAALEASGRLCPSLIKVVLFPYVEHDYPVMIPAESGF